MAKKLNLWCPLCSIEVVIEDGIASHLVDAGPLYAEDFLVAQVEHRLIRKKKEPSDPISIPLHLWKT